MLNCLILLIDTRYLAVDGCRLWYVVSCCVKIWELRLRRCFVLDWKLLLQDTVSEWTLFNDSVLKLEECAMMCFVPPTEPSFTETVRQKLLRCVVWVMTSLTRYWTSPRTKTVHCSASPLLSVVALYCETVNRKDRCRSCVWQSLLSVSSAYSCCD